jgi:flagellar hook-associated protein 3 FlgL
MTRISERSRIASTQTRIGYAKELADKSQQDAVSGRKLHHISDNPVGSTQILRNRHKLENIQQYRRTSEFVKGYMALTENTLLSINDVLIRTKELGVQQANATWDATARKAVASEVHELKDHLISLANTKYNGKFIFGGFQSQLPPVSPDGTFTGDDGSIFIQVDDDTFRPINISGKKVFDRIYSVEGREDKITLAEVLDHLYLGLEHNQADKIFSVLPTLETAMENTIQAITSLGSRRQALDDVSQRTDFAEEHLLSQSNQLESTDMIQAALDLQRMKTGLEFTLQSSAQMLSPSLLQFLK